MTLSDVLADLTLLEDIEKATLRLVAQALFDFRNAARDIFAGETDLPMDIAEDISREALDSLGAARVTTRLFGKVDYKRAQYVFLPGRTVKQALFVDSKAEKTEGRATVTLQVSQTSMCIRQIRGGEEKNVPGGLPTIIERDGGRLLTTTIFAKYNYREDGGARRLEDITVAGLPNGVLQDRYNPTARDTIWLAGRNSPLRGEDFRMRLSFADLRKKAGWRVQTIPMAGDFQWAQ